MASYSKGLPHNDLGEVEDDAYDALVGALSSGSPEDFEAIPMGEPDLSKRRKLVNPQDGCSDARPCADPNEDNLCSQLGLPHDANASVIFGPVIAALFKLSGREENNVAIAVG